MSKRKDKSIFQFNIAALATMCKDYFTPIGMNLALEGIEDKWLWFGVIKEAGELHLALAFYTANFQNGLAELIESILLDYHAGKSPANENVVLADLTSSQVAALTAYSEHRGVTVVLNLDSRMVEYYIPDQNYRNNIANLDCLSDNFEFFMCADLSDSLPRVKYDEFPMD